MDSSSAPTLSDGTIVQEQMPRVSRAQVGLDRRKTVSSTLMSFTMRGLKSLDNSAGAI